ncbi:unnamed protein product [Didymodactylos carnosus]|uniref:Uncharacterized protein n=1 Tax=Didymodactylos carnosus TaxID=1234261 RepID=A0A815UR03_9BILA|nr:unnamed protein product [Didymodactylos carnosus]CAF1522460.1 unnamed protein product [Didymodactylos carnosus]CAF4008236.1 unnamed protein product [Didymodactylos carnosus]CAF4381606.1 unnamed protein product [Didymodactylos carnosus]
MAFLQFKSVEVYPHDSPQKSELLKIFDKIKTYTSFIIQTDPALSILTNIANAVYDKITVENIIRPKPLSNVIESSVTEEQQLELFRKIRQLDIILYDSIASMGEDDTINGQQRSCFRNVYGMTIRSQKKIPSIVLNSRLLEGENEACTIVFGSIVLLHEITHGLVFPGFSSTPAREAFRCYHDVDTYDGGCYLKHQMCGGEMFIHKTNKKMYLLQQGNKVRFVTGDLLQHIYDEHSFENLLDYANMGESESMSLTKPQPTGEYSSDVCMINLPNKTEGAKHCPTGEYHKPLCN